MEIFSSVCKHSELDIVRFISLKDGTFIFISDDTGEHGLELDKQQAIELAKAILSYYEEG